MPEAGEGPEKKDDYRFIKEVIKETPKNPKALLVKLGCIVGGAILFGLIAAFVFVRFLPVLQEDNQKPEQIELGNDEPEEPTPTPQPTPTATPQAQETPVEAEPFGIEEYKNIYAEMNKVAREAMKSVVTVTGITSNEDWFNITTESTKQASGFIVANNGPEILILTEYRAVDTVDRVMVTFWDGTIVDGRYQKQDTNTGLTVVKVALGDMEAGTREGLVIGKRGNSYSMEQGEPVIAIGSPMGYSNSVVYGQITSVAGTVSTFDVEYNLLMTNILGSSNGSGVLVSLDGGIIGVISQQFGDNSNKNVIVGLPISQLESMIDTR